MNSFQKHISSLLFFSLCTASAQTYATTITFDGAVDALVPPNWDRIASFSAPYSESEYKLTPSNTTGAAFISPNFSAAATRGPASTSDFINVCACTALNDIVVTLARTDGTSFALNSLDAGLGYNLQDATSVTFQLTGLKTDNSFFSQAFTISDYQWHTLLFADNPDFSNLKELKISGIPGAPASLNALAAFDNINVSQVPVPSAIWLFGSGLLGLAALRRKRPV